MGIGLTSVWPSYVKSLFFDSDWGAKVFFMPRRRWLVPAPTRRIQIGSKMAPKVIMIFFSGLLFVGVYKAIITVAFVERKG